MECDDARLKQLLDELKDKDLNELIANGTEKLVKAASVGGGGG